MPVTSGDRQVSGNRFVTVRLIKIMELLLSEYPPTLWSRLDISLEPHTDILCLQILYDSKYFTF